jgi:pyridoxine 5-phosphate synthase
MATLGVNIDHIATIRQARGEEEPDPLEAAMIVEKAGAHGITVHLREDRRHIQDADVVALRKKVKTRLNLEMAATEEMVRFALKIKPDQVTLVPEKRQELTTEGGLNLVKEPERFEKAIDRIQAKHIPVSLFIYPDDRSIKLSAWLGATFIEIHTGEYSQAFRLKGKVDKELTTIVSAAKLAKEVGLRVHGGHGLTYENVTPIAAIREIEDLNIGHNIIARASMVGLERAVKEMLALLQKAKTGRKK